MTMTTWQEHETGSAYRPPAPVGLALSTGLEPTAVRLAVLWGQRDVNALTNLVFFHRHRERNGRPLARDESDYPALSREWIAIRDTIVRPTLEKPRPAALAAQVPGHDGLDHVRIVVVSRLPQGRRHRGSPLMTFSAQPRINHPRSRNIPR